VYVIIICMFLSVSVILFSNLYIFHEINVNFKFLVYSFRLTG